MLAELASPREMMAEVCAVDHWGVLVVAQDGSAQAALTEAEASQWSGKEAQQEKTCAVCIGHKDQARLWHNIGE